MSSRVQKGGQKFKPVAKPRGRPGETSSIHRTPSIAPEVNQGSSQFQPSPSKEQNAFSMPALSVALVSRSDQNEGSSASVFVQNAASSSREEVHNQPGYVNNARESDTETVNGTPITPSTQGALRAAAADTHQEIQRPMAAHLTASSRTVPTVVATRTQANPFPQVSRTVPVIQPTTPASSQDVHESVPTLHSLLQNVAPESGSQLAPDVEASQVSSQDTLAGAQAAMIPEKENAAESQAGPYTITAPVRTEETEGSSQSQRKPRKRANKARVESDAEEEGAEDAEDIEKRMTRRRKTSARPKTSVDATKGQSQPGSDQGAQKLKRKRQSTFKKSTAEGLSDTATSGTEGNASESETQCRRKRRRRSTTGSTSTRGRRSRNPSVTAVFDPDADPGEELDPTVVTMASICDDTGQGRVSSKAAIIQRNHLTWKATNKEKRARMRAVMEAKKYGRPEEEANEATESSQAVKEASVDDNASQIAESSGTPAVEDASGSGFNYRESMAINRFNAQVRIGPNGETIIDEESLYVDRAEDGDDGTDKYTHVEESDQTKFVNSASYGRKIRGSRWSAEETELFYDALSQFGENYELISYVLPGRDRKSCKNKFKTEDKKNSNRITFCLNNRVPYDMQTLSRLTGRDFSGPTPEIRAPEAPTLAEESQREPTPEQPARKTRKKSRTPCTTDDVEVMGDVETFDAGGSDD